MNFIKLFSFYFRYVNFFFFSDDSDWISEQIGSEFGLIEIVNHNFSNNSANDMRLMSNCDHNIIANSSFSWWGAYFNQNKGKIVCYPSIWFGPVLKDKHFIRDLCPEEWVKI